MPAHGSRENDLFQVAALADEILDRVAVRNPHHILFNDGPVVKDLGDVMAGGPNQLNAALKGLVVRSCSHKGGQE